MTTTPDKQVKEIREPSLLDALIPLIFMIVMLALSIVIYGLDASLGPLQVSLLMSAVVAAVVAHKNGHSWEKLGEEILGNERYHDPAHGRCADRCMEYVRMPAG